MRMHLKIYLKGETFVLPCEPFFPPRENIQHAIVPCQMTHTTMKVYNQQENVSFNMFNNNEAIQPKYIQREKTVDDNTGTITMSAELLGASVYMWNEGSHSSDVCWFRAKLE